MVTILIFYRKILDNVLLRTFPTPHKKNLNSPELSQPPTPPPPPHSENFSSPPPPRKFLNFPPKKFSTPTRNFLNPPEKSQPPKYMLTINPPAPPPPPTLHTPLMTNLFDL